MADAQAPRSRRAVPVQSAWLHSARSVRRRSHSHTKSNAQTRVSDRPTLRILRGVFGATVRRARRPPAHDTARSPRLWLDCTHDAARPAGRASPVPSRCCPLACLLGGLPLAGCPCSASQTPMVFQVPFPGCTVLPPSASSFSVVTDLTPTSDRPDTDLRPTLTPTSDRP
jgi:hypothetical protein